MSFEVHDTGRGMTAAQLQAAARMYVHSPAEEFGGMGLGLSLAARAVASLGGELLKLGPTLLLIGFWLFMMRGASGGIGGMMGGGLGGGGGLFRRRSGRGGGSPTRRARPPRGTQRG